MNRCLAVLLLFLCICFSASALSDRPETRQLIQATNARSDPAKTGPYSLLADVIVNPGTKQELHGQLRLLRDSNRSRIDLQFRDYHETHVREGNKLYVYRTTRRPVAFPSRLFAIEHVWQIQVTSRAKLGAIKRTNREQVAAECFSTKEPEWHDFETRYCVNAQDNSLIESKSEYEDTRLENYVKVGDSAVPSIIRYKTSDGDVMIRQIELMPLVAKDDTFAVPEGAREFETCDNVEGGSFVNRVEPVYPSGAGPGAATIYFRGIVQKDGSFTDVDVFSAEGPEFEKSGRAAAAQWRFSPPMCNGHPVAAENETVITVRR